MTDPTQRQHFVYRIWDAEGVLLYVGCTRRPRQRWLCHRQKPWWPRVATWRMYGPYLYDDALRLETAVIHAEKPLFSMSGTQVGQLGARRRKQWQAVDHAAGRRCQEPYCRPCDLTFGHGPPVPYFRREGDPAALIEATA